MSHRLVQCYVLFLCQVGVDVTVTDVDDEVARFERSWYRFDVVENAPGGTVVGRVSAVDHDLPPFNSFHYQLVATPGDSDQNDEGEICSLFTPIRGW